MLIRKNSLDVFFENINKKKHEKDSVISDFFKTVLSDPLTNYNVDSILEFYLSEIEKEKMYSNKYLGALGFFLFSLAAEKTNFRPKSPKDIEKEKYFREIATVPLNHQHTINFIKELYEINGELKQVIDKITFHRAGTTSFILKIDVSNKSYALKILKYRYLNNRTIEDSTKNYKTNYGGNYEYIPKIYTSSCKYILMDFIDGITLSELIDNDFFRRSSYKDKIIGNIILKLCDILHYFAQHEIIHTDLNPKNIIIMDPNSLDFSNLTTENVNIYLIDFGVNFLLNEKVGSSRALTRARVYIAEEVLDNNNNASIMSDIYSLGVILLELYNYNADADFNYREFDSYLYNLRLEHPNLASIMDDILMDDPNKRIFILQRENGNNKNILQRYANIYMDLKRNLSLEFRLNELKKEKQENKIFNLLMDLINFLTLDFSAVLKNQLIESKEVNDIRISEHEATKEYSYRVLKKNLGSWASIAVFSHLSVLIIFGIYFMIYLKADSLLDYLPGMIVCLSFSFVALRYYLGIFSNLYTKTLGNFGWITNLWIRFCTIYWPIPIFLVYHFNPKYWPFATFFGTFVVVINNLFCYLLAKQAESRIKGYDKPLAKSITDRLKEFEGWWTLMAAYSFGMLIMGVLLIKGILVDEIAFAIIILLINLKLYQYNNVEAGPWLNNTLQFYYSRYFTILKYKPDS